MGQERILRYGESIVPERGTEDRDSNSEKYKGEERRREALKMAARSRYTGTLFPHSEMCFDDEKLHKLVRGDLSEKELSELLQRVLEDFSPSCGQVLADLSRLSSITSIIQLLDSLDSNDLSRLPSIIQLLDSKLYRWPPPHRNRVSENIESLFAHFCFPESIPYFPDALRSKYCVRGEVASTREFDLHSYSEVSETGGSVGSMYLISGTVTQGKEETTWQLNYPVADGTRRAAAAMTLKETTPDLVEKIDHILSQPILGPRTYAETQDFERITQNGIGQRILGTDSR